MNSPIFLYENWPSLSKDFRNELEQYAIFNTFPAGASLIKEGQYLHALPIVLKGLVKVSKQTENKELLLYYIKPGEGCIMSFGSLLQSTPSQIDASTEEKSELLLLPAAQTVTWLKKYPEFNHLFFRFYANRYHDLIETIQELVFKRMDERLWHYLREKSALRKSNPLKISHRQIATELGTAREVVTRVMHKLEAEGKLSQLPEGIKLLKV